MLTRHGLRITIRFSNCYEDAVWLCRNPCACHLFEFSCCLVWHEWPVEHVRRFIFSISAFQHRPSVCNENGAALVAASFGRAAWHSINIGRYGAEDPGQMASYSFYPDGPAHEHEDPRRAAEEPAEASAYERAGWNERRTSYETSWSGFWEGNQGSNLDSVEGAGSTQESSQRDGWWWTPQMWVWGKSLDEGITECVKKGWITTDAAFCAWWQQQKGPAASKQGARSCEKGCDGSVSGMGEGRTGDDDLSSQRNASAAGSKPYTGKEHIPAHDGVVSMREYTRRVRLFQANTSIDRSYQAGKLIEKLTGQAWESCETLDVSSLRCPDGVEKLLSHLWQELEPLEHLRVATTLSDFYQKFRRSRGQQFTAYDTAFRSQCLRLKECGAELSGAALAFWFLEKANIGEDLKRQVISGASGKYEYSKLREALVAIVPQVHHEEKTEKRWARHDYSKPSNRVHMADAAGSEDSVHGGDGPKPEEGGEPEDDPEQLEYEAEVLLTHAAKKRAAADKNRGFQKPETEEERSKRIENMKAKMACAACRSHGHIRYGHWHGDEACPYFDKSKPKAKPVFVVSQDPPSDGDSDDAFIVHFCGQEEDAVVLASNTSAQTVNDQVALADTCCARTVAGCRWMERHLKCLDEKKIPYVVLPDHQPFRFGDGPRLTAFAAVVCPIYVGQENHMILLRISVVDHDVPLLVSSRALKAMGTVVDLTEEKYQFKTIKTEIPMVQTKTGHIGFRILEGSDYSLDPLLQLDWSMFTDASAEIAFAGMGSCAKDRGRLISDSWHRRGSHEHECEETDGSSSCKDEQNVFVLSQPQGVVLKPSHCCATSRADSAHEVIDGKSLSHESGSKGAQEEGRVRCSPVRVDSHPQVVPGGNVTGEAAGDLQLGQTSDHPPTPSQLEALCKSRAPRPLRGKGVAVDGNRHPRHSPSSVDTRPFDCGADQLRNGSGDIRSFETSRTRGSTYMPSLQGEDARASEPDDKHQVLGVCSLSRMHPDIQQDVCRSASSNGAVQPEARWLCEARRWVEARKEDLGGWIRGNERRADQKGSPNSTPDREQLGRSGGSEPRLPGQEELREPMMWRASPEPEQVIHNKIRNGNQRRRLAKRGTWKRLIGNCAQLATAVVMFTSVCVGAAVDSCCFLTGQNDRPDVIEIFGGAAEVSLQFAQRGWRVIQPIDVQYGLDLKSEDTRKEIIGLIKDKKPRLVLIEWPCKFWGKLTDVNYNTLQRRRKLNMLRKEERPFLEMTEEIFKIQVADGNDALAENPLASYAFKEPPIKRVLEMPEVHVGVSHACRFNFRDPVNDQLIKNPTMWVSTSPEIIEAVSLKCINRAGNVDHCHRPCLGSKVTSHAAQYTKELAKAIHKGFIKTMKRKDPDRLRQLMNHVHKQIGKQENETKLVWTRDAVNKVRKESHVLVNENPGGQAVDDVSTLADGISFEIPPGRKLDPGARSVLRKLHSNLGHPSTKDLQRFMRNGGAPQRW